jgi:hypothetical protein
MRRTTPSDGAAAETTAEGVMNSYRQVSAASVEKRGAVQLNTQPRGLNELIIDNGYLIG